MKSTLKRWAGLGLGTAFLGTGLAGCGSAEEDVGATAAEEAQEAQETIAAAPAETAPEPLSADDFGEGGEGEGGEGEGGEGEGGESGEAIGALPLPHRLAFMTGHVKAGLALYRAGEPQMASQHLLHPVSETHEAERAGLDALGFDAAVFETVSKALEEGKPAAEVEPMLVAAEKNLAEMSGAAGGEDADVIRFLMETIVDEYTVAITDGAVSDPGEYQDAYGFAIVARERIEGSELRTDGIVTELDTLIGLWPEAPVPPESPAPIGQVIAQTSKVVLELPAE